MKRRKKHMLIICGASLGLLIFIGALNMTVLAFDRQLPGEAAPVLTPWEAPSGERYWRVSAGAANAWLLPAEGGYLMVDTGYPGDYTAFRRGLDAVGIDIDEIRYLFITHAHDEHAGFAAALKNDSGYRPIFMEDRREVYASLELLKSRGARWILTGYGDPFPVEKLPRYLEQTGPGPGLSALGSYLMKLTPGFLLMFLLLFLGGRNNQGLRIFLYLLGFILMRDLMTPFGFWSFGSSPVFWIRFAADGALLTVLALASLGMSALVLINEGRAGKRPRWFKAGAGKGTLAGLLGALIVTLPLLLAYRGILPGERGGAFPATLVPQVLFLGLSGNLLEELLFRGYLQPWLEKSGLSGSRAALSSGLLFGLCHVFLAYTVTDVGWPLVVFATWEGILCGFIHRKYGLAPAVLTHGLAVSLLAVV